MESIVLGLGSNKSYNNFSPLDLLKKAVNMLSEFISDLEYSSVYKTAAMYHENQEDFYNMVVSGKFSGSPRDLLNKIHEVENKLGRNRESEFRNGPRSMDIDIELFSNFNVNEEDLIIPHERLYERAFVLVPLLEIFSKNAEERNKRLFLIQKLSLLGDQRIDKCLDKKDFFV